MAMETAKPIIKYYLMLPYVHNTRSGINKKLSWCWQTRATRLEVSQGHQT